MGYTVKAAKEKIKILYEDMCFHQELAIICEIRTKDPKYADSKNFYFKEFEEHNKIALKELSEIDEDSYWTQLRQNGVLSDYDGTCKSFLKKNLSKEDFNKIKGMIEYSIVCKEDNGIEKD